MRVVPRSSLRSCRGVIAIVAFILLLLASLSFAQPPNSTWRKVTTATAPSARSGCVMAYDPISQKVVMFGGWDGSSYPNDTWTFDGTNWTQVITATAPPGRAGGGAAYDSTLQKVVLYGGFDHQYLNDTWLWDGATSTWTEATPAKTPKAVTGPMVFPDPLTGNADEFGGWDGRRYQLTTWRLRDDIWHKQYPKQFPSARAAGVIGTNPVLKQTVVFGGLADVNPVNTWTFDGKNWTQQSPATQPEQRLNVGTVYDPRFHGVVTFGGFTGQDNNDMWLWDGTNWTQLFPKKSPPPREQMGMAFDDVLLETVVFGGLSGNQLLNDTWVLKMRK